MIRAALVLALLAGCSTAIPWTADSAAEALRVWRETCEKGYPGSIMIGGEGGRPDTTLQAGAEVGTKLGSLSRQKTGGPSSRFEMKFSCPGGPPGGEE